MRRHILFIALSGVRVREPELRQLGMSLPGFIERGEVIARLPSLGLLTLAGYTPPDWEVDYRELDTWDESLVAEFESSAAPLVAISSLTARIQTAYRLANRLRRAGKTVLLGGLHVSSCPDEATQHADVIVVGEGEPVWPHLIHDAEHNQLQPSYHAKDYPPLNYNAGPLPRYDLLAPGHYNRLTIQTTRGCPLDCEFSGASRLISPYKKKSLDRIRLELDHLATITPKPFIELADDNTFVSKRWGRNLAQLISEYNFHWFTETDISVADDERLLEQLAHSGCAQLLIGLESAAPQSLNRIDSRNWKRTRYDAYPQAIERIQQHGISVNGCFTLGGDEETEAIFETTRDYVRTLNLSEVQITILTPFPGTQLYQRFRDTNRILPQATWDDFTLFDVTYQPRHMSVDTLRQGFRWLMQELYSESASQHRKAQFREIMRQGAQLRRQDTNLKQPQDSSSQSQR